MNQTSLRGENIDEKDDNDFRDMMGKKEERTIRIVFQNICHISPSKATSKNNQIIRFANDNDVDILLMAEIGLKWDKVPSEDQWAEKIYGCCDKEKHVFAYNEKEPDIGKAVQFGGLIYPFVEN